VAEEIVRIEAQGDAAALADSRERQLAERLARVRDGLAQVEDPAQREQMRERLRRVSGALTWQQAEQFAQRLWQAKKAMREIDVLLPQARGRAQSLAEAQVGEPAHFDRFAARIGALESRIDHLLPRTTELARAQRAYVQELAAAALLRQKVRLEQYAGEARFAVARLYDRAHLAADSHHDGRP
jgi:hypothetical protein